MGRASKSYWYNSYCKRPSIGCSSVNYCNSMVLPALTNKQLYWGRLNKVWEDSDPGTRQLLFKNWPDLSCHLRNTNQRARHVKSQDPNAVVTSIAKALWMSNPFEPGACPGCIVILWAGFVSARSISSIKGLYNLTAHITSTAQMVTTVVKIENDPTLYLDKAIV